MRSSRRNLQVILVLALLAGEWCGARADIGPKPIHHTGAWNDPGRFRLQRNTVRIELGRDEARVTACFVLVSTVPLRVWDEGVLEWTWPIPEGQPPPESLSARCYNEYLRPAMTPRGMASVPDSQQLGEDMRRGCGDGLSEVRPSPTRVIASAPLGIHSWLLYSQNFVITHPVGAISAHVQVTYRQAYRRVAGAGKRSMRYVLRSGALWNDSIGELTIQVVADQGVRLVGSSLLLRDGLFVRREYEPAGDLVLQVRIPGR